jgi:HAD superfamily hydrolase (TIGR01509 family)
VREYTGNMSFPASIKAVIFDMDGVLVESEPLHRRAELMLYEHRKIPMTYEDLERFAGMPDRKTFRVVLTENDCDASEAETMFEEKYEKTLPAVLSEYGLRAVNGAVETVRKIATLFPLALASSSPHCFINLVLSQLKLEKEFPIRISSEDVSLDRGKPEPDMFLLAAKKLNAEPKHCLVIEDSSAGVRAAKAAGMQCIGFQNPGTGEQDLSAADVRIKNMHEVISILVKETEDSAMPLDFHH